MKMGKKRDITLFLFVFMLLANFLFAQNNKIGWATFDTGFESPAGINSKINSAIGQSFVGTTRNTNSILYSGFLIDSLFLNVVTDVQDNDNQRIPKTYKLSQNYPNPFNPSTTIRYEVPKGGLVLLKVYDILGREVASLVNEEKQPGNYEVRFDASILASGIYIYRIQAGNFVQAKKMILLK